MHVIIGATGNIGSKIVNELLSQSKIVKAIGRSSSKAKSLIDKGVKFSEGNILDTKFLTETLKDATSVFAMIPPNMSAEDPRKYQNQVSDAIIEAIKNSGVKNVVALSSIGAQLNEKAGIILGLHDFEEKLKSLKGVNVKIIRASYFMENLFNNIGLIKNMGVNGSPLKPDLCFPLVATKDIAHKAAEHLAKLDFTGFSVEYVLGPKDMSLVEVTSVIGKSIGKPDLKYVQFPYEDAEKAMTNMGLSPNSAKAMVEFQKTMNEDGLLEKNIRNNDSTTPTTLEEFANEFAEVYSNK